MQQMIKRKYLVCCMMALFFGMLAPMSVTAAEKQTIHNSPYVTFSPDRRAWTTNAGDRNYIWYEKGTRVITGIPSTLRSLQTGEHYYRQARRGEIPIGYWQVYHKTGNCIHNSYPEGDYHGIEIGRKKCMGYYYSGWNPCCADCGESITNVLMYMYMSREAAESIDYLSVGNKNSYDEYYYLCPHCNNLEQGAALSPHQCKAISWNQYKVEYEANTGSDIYGGYMPDSLHMYQNAAEYEGKKVTPVTHLTKNAYTRQGYIFTGWNTKPDGSGTSYADEAEILNLTAADHRDPSTWKEGENGIVRLYAQWRFASGTLVLDGQGGTYNGSRSYSITDSYGKTYLIDNGLLSPPTGYTVSFQTNGGSVVPSIQGTRQFVEWSREQPFRGRMNGNTYYFTAPDGNIDTLRAKYTHNKVTLPNTSRTDSSFGGWYYDPEFAKPAGGPGDTIIPDRDVTLYAQWVDLTLKAADNYKTDGGRGAVDLSWTQSDGRNKTYMLYQSRDGQNWVKINTADDVGNGRSVKENFQFSGSTGKYTVPYGGFYTLSVDGAQGGGYGGLQGGRGGRVTAKVWLSQGEVITYTVGGQSGYNGGGSASAFGNGGGMTSIRTDKKGLLLIAGGGGGASPAGNGEAGGSEASVISGNYGQGGMAGGGAGYRGGTAGEKIVHNHSDAAGCYRRTDYTPSGWKYFCGVGGAHSVSTGQNGGGGHTNSTEKPHVILCMGTEQWYIGEGPGIPTNGNTRMHLTINSESWGSTSGLNLSNSYITVYDQNKNAFFSKYFRNLPINGSGSDGEVWEGDDGWHGTPDVRKTVASFGVDIPAGTTNIYIKIYAEHDAFNAHFGTRVEKFSFSGGKQVICGYREGQVISSKPAYGGSNYINTAYTGDYISEIGKQTGNGVFSIQSESIGYLEALRLDGVRAWDLAAPDKILEEEIEKEALSGKEVRITWKEPKDHGTVYYHKAESYPAGSVALLCTSNITENTLTSGIKGYYWLVDEAANTAVEGKNGSFIQEAAVVAAVKNKTQYLHVAAVDRAGNTGDTVHIRIGAGDVAWKLYTEQLVIEETDNVYLADGDKLWYVRADGETPFLLEHSAYMDGEASLKYQLNYTIYETRTEEGTAKNIFYTPSEEITDQDLRTDASEISYSVEGMPPLGYFPYFYTVRSDRSRRLVGTQKFTLDKALSGQRIQVTPISGADKGGEIIYSSFDMDKKNGITIIGDGEAPVITGLERLEDLKLIDRREGNVILDVLAADALSGIREFFIKIHNVDNAVEQVYTADESNRIRMEITADEPIFSGDFTVTALAVDNVGNRTELSYGATEFSLETEIKRILEPHEPLFKGGESGILSITTWGYADRVEVEFAEELTALHPDLNHTYIYADAPQYMQEEKLQFMIPLYAPANQSFTITVRAYKGNRKLEEYPSLGVIEVGENVLGDFRTRLR